MPDPAEHHLSIRRTSIVPWKMESGSHECEPTIQDRDRGMRVAIHDEVAAGSGLGPFPPRALARLVRSVSIPARVNAYDAVAPATVFAVVMQKNCAHPGFMRWICRPGCPVVVSA